MLRGPAGDGKYPGPARGVPGLGLGEVMVVFRSEVKKVLSRSGEERRIEEQ